MFSSTLSVLAIALLVVAFCVSYIAARLALRPRGVPIVGLSSPILSWATALLYFFRCGPIARDAYCRYRGSIFAIPTLWNFHVCVSDVEKLKDVNRAHPNHLSLNQFLEEASFPEYTIDGFHFTATDPRNKLSVRALMNGLRKNLPILRPKLRERVERIIDSMVADNKDVYHGWSRVSSSQLSLQIAGDLISFVILGESFAQSSENVSLAVQYAFDAMVTTQALAPLPKVLHPLVGPLLMRRTGSCRRLRNMIYEDVKSRISERSRNPGCGTLGNVDCVQWMLDTLPDNDDETAHQVTQRALGMIFAGMFQPQMFITFTLYELCVQQQCVDGLRQEVAAAAYSTTDNKTPDHNQTLLDSFLKEVARLNPLRAVSIDRKVMADFYFSDGTLIKAGNTIAVPQQAILLDESIYPDPTSFKPSRFLQNRPGTSLGSGFIATSDKKFVHPSANFPFWGAVSRPCPARFYVSTVVKETVRHILSKYSIQLDKDYDHPRISWGPNVVPNPRIGFRLKLLDAQRTK